MSQPELELIYFDGAGRAEAVRIFLHAAGLEFKDTRFKGAEWPSIKPTTPLGFVPVLKVDGKPYCQSVALVRFAAKKAKWYPSDDVEAMLVDEVFDNLNELMSKAPRSKDPAEMEKLRKEFEAGTMTTMAKYLEEKIQTNGGCYVVGETPTMADMGIQQIVKSIQSGMWDHINKDFWEAYPGITATSKAVDENEQVKAYYASKS